MHNTECIMGVDNGGHVTYRVLHRVLLPSFSTNFRKRKMKNNKTGKRSDDIFTAYGTQEGSNTKQAAIKA